LAAFVFCAANNSDLIWVNILQERMPRELQGRVSSVDYLGSSLIEPEGLALSGWATKWLGPALIFVVGGGLRTLLITL
jgi:hypothetical protein